MRITDVRTIPYAIRYRKPLHFASGQIDVADNVLVEVVTDDGVTGIAHAEPNPSCSAHTAWSMVSRSSRASRVEGVIGRDCKNNGVTPIKEEAPDD